MTPLIFYDGPFGKNSFRLFCKNGSMADAPLGSKYTSGVAYKYSKEYV